VGLSRACADVHAHGAHCHGRNRASAGAAVIVALAGQPASNDGHTSMAAHALVRSAPVINAVAASPKAAKHIQVPAPRTASASAGPAGRAAALIAIPSAVGNGGGEPSKMVPSANAPVSARPAASGAIRTTVETAAGPPAERAGTALEMKPEKNQRKHMARRFRHRRLYDEYGERGLCCAWRQSRFDSMDDGW
jgi:hypothetical protein